LSIRMCPELNSTHLVSYLIFGEFGVVHVLGIEPSAPSDNVLWTRLTLYQCFFTLPSVRAGNACFYKPEIVNFEQ
jgi:hypothetical protein